jgi:hypothetical protein
MVSRHEPSWSMGDHTSRKARLGRALHRRGQLPGHCPQHAQTDALVAELRAQLAEMRSQRDAWQGIAERLALGAPKPEPAGPKGVLAAVAQIDGVGSGAAAPSVNDRSFGARQPAAHGLADQSRALQAFFLVT